MPYSRSKRTTYRRTYHTFIFNNSPKKPKKKAHKGRTERQNDTMNYRIKDPRAPHHHHQIELSRAPLHSTRSLAFAIESDKARVQSKPSIWSTVLVPRARHTTP